MRKAMLSATLMVCCGLGGPAWMAAQMGASGAETTHKDPAKALDGMLTMFEKEMMSAANAMPAEKYDFSPATLPLPGAKFTGVRTFADEVRHVAQANFYFASACGGTKVSGDVRAIGGLKSKDEIVKALEDSFAALHAANASITAANFFDSVQMEGGMFTRGTISTFAVAHGNDHYGQMVEYLRMNGIVPPASAK